MTAEEGERVEFGGARGFERFGGDLGASRLTAIMQDMGRRHDQLQRRVVSYADAACFSPERG